MLITSDRLDRELIGLLEEFEFEGTDASYHECLYFYGGMYSEKHSIALLTTDFEDPPQRIDVQHITLAEIEKEVRAARAGFLAFIGVQAVEEAIKMPPATTILALKQWNGGWHQNSREWSTQNEWSAQRLREVIERVNHAHVNSETS